MSPPESGPKEPRDPSCWLDLHGDVLYGFAQKFVTDPAVAEDLVQDTFVAALRARASFAGQSSEQTWLIGILKKKVMDHFRRRAREVPFDTLTSVASEDDPDFIQTGPDQGSWQPHRRPARWSVDPNDPLEQREFWKYLQLCLAGLETREARLFVLREVEEVDYEDLSNVFGLSQTNLRVILFRARKQLRRCLEKRWLQACGRKS